jgi:hypothetical protein
VSATLGLAAPRARPPCVAVLAEESRQIISPTAIEAPTKTANPTVTIAIALPPDVCGGRAAEAYAPGQPGRWAAVTR